MSWIDKELPVEWPQNDDSDRVNKDASRSTDFSTTQSGSDDTAAPTVAVQTGIEVRTPEWKKAIIMDEGKDRLSKLFLPPKEEEEEEEGRMQSATLPDIEHSTSASDMNNSNSTTTTSLRSTTGGDSSNSITRPVEHNSNNGANHFSTSASSTSTSQSEPDLRNVTRKLKVFGQADTYTNERFGNLLNSVGGFGNSHDEQTKQSSIGTSTTDSHLNEMNEMNGMNELNELNEGVSSTPVNEKKPKYELQSGNTSQSESDQDLGRVLQQEGRQLLKGLAPYQSDLATVPESSLDQLELQLTSQGNNKSSGKSSTNGSGKRKVNGKVNNKVNGKTNDQARKTGNSKENSWSGDTLDTTTSKESDQTLESLTPMGSHWDAFDTTRSKHRSTGSSGKWKPPLALKDVKRGSNNTGTTSTAVSTQTRTKNRNFDVDVSELNIADPPYIDLSHEYTLPKVTNANQFSSSGDDSVFTMHKRPHPSQTGSVLRFNESSNEEELEHTGLRTARVRPMRSAPPASGFPSSGVTPGSQVRQSNSRASNPRVSNPRMAKKESFGTNNRTNNPESLINMDENSTMLIGNDQDSITQPAPSNGNETFNFTFLPGNMNSNDNTSNSERRKTAPVLNLHPSADISHVTFSCSYKDLFRLIRERTRADADKFDEITSLDLSNCELETIVGLDEICPNLTTLFLNNNKLKALYGLPPSVVYLDLSSNELDGAAHFPASFVSMLILRDNRLESLQCLRNLRALSSLDVSNNRLESTKGVESLTALRFLNVSNNELEELDLNLGILAELEAANNNIQGVRLKVPYLEMLQLENNSIVAFNEFLPLLRGFNIRFNNTILDMSGVKNLETLLFDGNKAIKNFSPRNLRTFSWEQSRSDTEINIELKQLRQCRDIKATLPKPLTKGVDPMTNFYPTVYAAQHLDLAASNLKKLPRKFSRMFPFLRSLNLAFNHLQDDCIDVLKECKALRRVSLFGNKLNTTEAELAIKLPNVVFLDSRGQCSGSMILHNMYATSVYTNVMNTMVPTKLKSTPLPDRIEWLDGIDYGLKKADSPGFPSALFPETLAPSDGDESVFNEEDSPKSNSSVQSDSQLATVDDTDVLEVKLKDVMSDEDAKWDFVKSVYLHYYLQAHNKQQ